MRKTERPISRGRLEAYYITRKGDLISEEGTK
jgi:hypothetical protein